MKGAMKQKRIKKPKPLMRWDQNVRASIVDSNFLRASISSHAIEIEDARRIAQWLLDFAEWGEQRIRVSEGKVIIEDSKGKK